ncbi:hypothetical protein RUM4293_01280 [Ruegeria atlantica]|uniref:Uncharacterized protein n=1 Tax=Ruegeria atlantica TaxID=81569 RepID=A0A0P1E2I1_9RHOB|nr:hypothetical protein RUM4293_01280 [Ruegeria atlantica]
MNLFSALWIAVLASVFSAGTAATETVHFSGLYVPQGLSCEDGAQISAEYGDLRAGYVIYDDEGRKSDDGDCSYAQVQALRGTAMQIVDLSCSYDGQSYGYRQLLTPLEGNRMLVVNSNDGTTSRFQIYTYCSWVPEN